MASSNTPATTMTDPQPAAPPAPPLSAALPTHLNYPDSVDSSPRSRHTDTWDEPLANATNSRLRLMCSYGGHIVPRPHDKSLCYVGGETRMVVVDRQTSLSDLSARLAKTLLNNRQFTLKYQLPNEDLDSLISVTTDEDLENMIDEYDRTANNSSNPSLKPSRLRLFLFPLKPEASQSIGPILDSSVKSEDWFLDALNGAGLLNRGFSDSASVNCLLGLDDDVGGGAANNFDLGGRDVEGSQPGSFGNSKSGKLGQDVHSVPDSPMLDTTSSFGSTSSSPSLANLPPIRVHVEDGGVRIQDQKVGIEEQFAQINVGGGIGQKQQDEGFVGLSSPPPPMPTINATAVVSAAQGGSTAVVGDYTNRVVSDDERSDHGVPSGYWKPSTPRQQPLPPQSQQRSSSAFDLPSPDSVSSDSSITNPMSRSKPVIYQDQVGHFPLSAQSRLHGNPANVSDMNTRVRIQQQVHDSGYVLQPQYEHQQQQQPQPQQYIHASAHYINQHPTGALPISAYYPLYPSQQQYHHPHQLEQQYPVYYMPSRQAQAYSNSPIQQNNGSEAPTVNASAIPSNRPQVHQNPAMVAASASYNPISSASPVAKHDISTGVYRPSTSVTSPLVQVPSSQNQHVGYAQQGYSHIHHPSQSVTPTSATANYTYEYANPGHAQIFYTQPLVPSQQYQAMVLPEGSAQLPPDNIKQQMRTSQQL